METPYTVAAAVLATVEAALIACSRPVKVALVAAGSIVVDDCCAGQLTVAVERQYRTIAPFPTEAGPDDDCRGHRIGLDLVVRVDRCVPVLTNAGKAPAASAQEEADKGIYTDAAIVWGAVVSDALVGEWWERANVVTTYTPAEGGCKGSETRFTLGIPSAGWCVDCPEVPVESVMVTDPPETPI